MKDKIRVRFAPSPTGHLHIGGVRTALFNYLFSKHHNGNFILRIEDTDSERSKNEYETEILNSLKLLNLHWDEGPDKESNVSFRQSDRMHIYERYITQLIAAGSAYRCFCDKESLEKEREEQIKNKSVPKYSGKCRNLNEHQITEYLENDMPYSVRFHVSQEQDIEFVDMIKGNIKINSNQIGDFIIQRSDGIPTYNFTVVVDDALMQITHVLRGDDHIANTPKQILLYRSLNFNIPEFGHLPMILGPDGKRLSKRHGSTSINEFINNGYLPESLINYIALLGWSPEDESEINSLDELINKMNITRVSKSAAIFDYDKLQWMNGQYIQKMDFSIFKNKTIQILKDDGVNIEKYDEEKINKILKIGQRYCRLLTDITDKTSIFFKENIETNYSLIFNIIPKETLINYLRILSDNLHEIEKITLQNFGAILKSVGSELELKGKSLYMPIRILLTNDTNGPELQEVVEIFGLDKMKKIINCHKEKLS